MLLLTSRRQLKTLHTYSKSFDILIPIISISKTRFALCLPLFGYHQQFLSAQKVVTHVMTETTEGIYIYIYLLSIKHERFLVLSIFFYTKLYMKLEIIKHKILKILQGKMRQLRSRRLKRWNLRTLVRMRPQTLWRTSALGAKRAKTVVARLEQQSEWVGSVPCRKNAFCVETPILCRCTRLSKRGCNAVSVSYLAFFLVGK